MIRLFINTIEYTNYITDTPILSAEFEDGKLIGNAPSVCFNVTLDNSDKTFNSLLNEEFVVKDYETNNQIGVFKVVEKPERITNELVLSLYDNMIDTNISYDTDTTMYPTTIEKQIEEMEVMLSRTIDTTELGNTVLKYPAEWYDNTISIRDFLCFIGELGACNLFCTKDGNYVFKKIIKTNKHTLPISDVETVDVIEDFECTRVMFDNGAIIPIEKGTETGNTIFVSKDNSYIETQEQIDYIYSCVSGLKFKTMESMICVEMKNLYLGDIFTFNNINFIALKYSHELLSGEFGIQTIDGNLVIKNAELVTQHIDNSLKIHRLKTEFDQEKLKWSVTAQEVEGQNEKIAQLELSTDEINQSITKIEETIKEIDTSYYHADLTCSGTSITRDNSSITMSVKLLDKSDEVTTSDSVFNWKRVSSNTESDTTWNDAHKGRKSITITSSDLEASANFYCEVSAPEWQGSTSAITVVDEVKSQVPVGTLIPNLPTTQTLDENGKVTPVWGLTLIPSMTFGIFSPDISEITTVWKRRINDDPLTSLTSKEVVKDNVLIVTGDILSEAVRSVTYYCYMQYEYSTCMAEQTFTLVKDGQSGTDGISIVSTATMYAVNNSDEVPPTSGWITSRPERSASQYLWRKLRITYSDGTQTELEAECITGDKGDTGIGIKSLTNYYLASASASGVSTSTAGWTTAIQTISASKKYLWNYERVTYTDDSVSDTVPCIIGTFGADGATGVGISSIAEYYQVSTSNATAPTNWLTAVPTLTAINKYLWNYEKITYTDGTSKDTAKRVIGVYGDKGDAGKGIKSYAITYQASSSGTTAPTGTWSSTIPTVQQGQYLWSRTITTYTDDETSTAYSVSYIPINGTSVSVKSTSVMYQVSTNGTTAPTGEWKSSIPTVPKGQYLWTRTIVTYTDDKSTTAYSVSYQPTNGSNGTSVTVSSTKTTYQASNSGTTVPTGTWSDTPVAGTAGQYVWTRTIVTYSDGKSTTSYSISRNGNNGATGATGTSTASTVQQYFLSTSKVNPTGGTWTTTPPTWSSGKYLWTRFVITYKNPASTEYTVPVCDSSWEAVNEIEVGGRNLLQGTKDFKKGLSTGTLDTEIYKGFSVAYKDNSAGTTYSDVVYYTSAIDVEVDTYYTLSFYAKGSGSLTSYFYPSNVASGVSSEGKTTTAQDGSISHTLTTDWKRYWITWKTSATATGLKNVLPMRLSAGSKGYICGIMFSKGNVAIDWSSALEDVQDDINNAVNNATNQINTTITATNERIDTLSNSVQKISETVTKTSDDLKETSSKLLTIESTVNEHKTSITKISTIENSLTGKVDKSELEVYMRFYELLGSPNLEFGASTSTTKNTISNEGSIVTVNGIAQTIINSSGLIANNITTKRIMFDANHSIYTNSSDQLIIQ